MAHAAAKTDEPIREGVVAGMGPFIDTLIICTMSALVLLMTGVWNRPEIGTVASVEGTRVIVQPNGELEARFARAYLRDIAGGTKLSIYTSAPFPKTVADTPTQLSLPTLETQPDGAAAWSAVSAIVLDGANVGSGGGASAADLLEPGMPVHLSLDGAEMMRFAFDTGFKDMGRWIITIGVCLFAFSTMISWSYYGEKGAEYLFGPGAILPYKFVFVVFVFLGMVLQKFATVYDFSDATSGLMVLCNLPAILILLPNLIAAASDYFRRLDAGAFKKRR